MFSIGPNFGKSKISTVFCSYFFVVWFLIGSHDLSEAHNNFPGLYTFFYTHNVILIQNIAKTVVSATILHLGLIAWILNISSE